MFIMTSNGKKTSILSEIMPSLKGEASSTGLVVNDPMGLCIVAEGRLSSDRAGVFTNLLHLAAQLPTTQTADSEQAPPEMEGPTTVRPNSCIVTIEMEDASILVKNYDGYTVALQLSNATTDDTAVSTPNRANHVVPSSDPAHASLSESSSMEPDGTVDPTAGPSDMQ
jgi:Ragulator complex protein LAMTOR5